MRLNFTKLIPLLFLDRSSVKVPIEGDVYQNPLLRAASNFSVRFRQATMASILE